VTTDIEQERRPLPIGSLSERSQGRRRFRVPQMATTFLWITTWRREFCRHHVAATISAITTWWPWCHEHHMAVSAIQRAEAAHLHIMHKLQPLAD